MATACFGDASRQDEHKLRLTPARNYGIAVKMVKAPPMAAPEGRPYCFKVPLVLGSTAEARWKEKLYALLI
jgi:hypothetical protein